MQDSVSRDLVVREYRPGDEVAILDAFNRVFPLIDPTFHARSMAEWHWRTLENPAGWRLWIAQTSSGEVVAQQAGLPIRMLHRGEPVVWNQIVDSFADPRYGRGLKRPGLFVQVAQPFCDTYGGPPPQDQIMYGMPVRRAYRIGQKFLGYQLVRDQHRLRADARQLQGRAAPGVVLEECARFPADSDAFFERARQPHRAIAVRDRAFLDWRFATRPDTRYRIALARSDSARTLLGYAVYARGSFDLHDGGLVCDWLVDPAHAEAGAALRAWIGACARADGLDQVIAVLPETCADFVAFQRDGFRVESTSYFTAAGSYTRTFHTLDLYWDWYYTLADFDLC
jgi:hypothetical protein